MLQRVDKSYFSILGNELIGWLAPHGAHYARFARDADDGSRFDHPRSFQRLMREGKWIPCRDGSRLISPAEGWLPTRKEHQQIVNDTPLKSCAFVE
eukprot:TRINITY_DN85072_c0_g1_i1.p1 TRINITY_DN85072_c0_g1~~TRINITY_DN85072_c0_g1_i1.p1  ORF type:complete len:108 (+),score=13.00 TRINITY_DN85072_c0_g1_i1:39-326(+)